ncbi:MULTISPECIES: outer membrane protein [Legionella]|nr:MULTISPECIES: hypothetical protein [Legionella]PJE17969.1 MAG: hypothetical protein CK430_00980 [Legionella sp.]
MDFAFKLRSLLVKISHQGQKKLIFSFLILPSLLHANNLTLFISGGPHFPKLNQEQLVRMNSWVSTDYQSYQKNHWKGFWGGGFNHSFEKISKRFNLSLGLAGYSLDLGPVQGKVYPFINGGFFDALDYRFNARNYSLMAESRLTYANCNWQPFLLAGVGQAWNRLKNYTEITANFASSATPLSPGFSNHRHHNFAYELGLGLQHPLFEDKLHKISYLASLGYRYFNLGKARLNYLPEQTPSSQLGINNLHTQSIVFSIDVSFN